MEHQINILVVDDEQIVLDSVRKHLRKTDYNLETVSSAREALKMLAMKMFHLVLTDLMMPDIDGLELMKMVKSRYPRIPVIMITGYAAVDTGREATQLGSFDNLAKPFSKVELLTAIDRALDFVRQAKPHENDVGKGDNAEE